MESVTTITTSKLIKYADDTTTYMTGNSSEIIQFLNNYDIQSLIKWFSSNKRLLSESKTAAIQFHKTTFASLDDSQLVINDKVIQFENSIKLLGIRLDWDLSWSTHIDFVHSKLSSALYNALNRCKNLLNSLALKQVYFGLMHSHLQYGYLFGVMLIHITPKNYLL